MDHLNATLRERIEAHLSNAPANQAEACREFITRMIADRTVRPEPSGGKGVEPYIKLYGVDAGKLAAAYVNYMEARIEIALPWEDAKDLHNDPAVKPVGKLDPDRRYQVNVYLTTTKDLVTAAILTRRALAKPA